MVDILKTFNQAEHGLQDVAERLESPYPVILKQGVEGEKILSIKIATEKILLEAGTSIVEGIDRLFKLFWCFNIEYQPSTIMFWQFLRNIYGLQYGLLSNGVAELRSTLAKYV